MTEPNENEKPPLFPRWSTWYMLVAVWLISLIILFYVFTKTYS